MSNISINAAKIALLSKEDGTSTDQVDRIVMAAGRLSAIESEQGFYWEDQKTDWESVCQMIADRMRQRGGEVPSRREIARMIRKEN